MKALKSLSIILILASLAVVFVFQSCKEDDYDFNKIVPKIFEISGPEEVAAHGLPEFPYEYSVLPRGGSSFAWEVTGHGGTIVQDPVKPYKAKIAFNQSSLLTEATVTVIETTAGGVASEPFSKTIILNPFCPYDLEPLIGNWSGTSANNDEVLVATTTEKLNELKIKGLAGFINFDWGENWLEGDGSCMLEFSCGDVVTIARQEIGKTDYPDTYEIEGSGTYNPATSEISLTYIVFYTGGSTSEITTVLSKNSKLSRDNNRLIK